MKKLSGELETAQKASAASQQESAANGAKEADIRKEMENTKKALAETTQKLDKLQSDMGSKIKGLEGELEKSKAEKAELEKSQGTGQEKEQKLQEQEKVSFAILLGVDE